MITVHIERLVLEGLTLGAHQHRQLRAAIEAELARLLAADGLRGSLAQGGAVPSVAASPIQLAGDDPGVLGQQIARAVYGGISR